jgi:2-amino-4-hydroxy-6-hydroxymethyldihydropteridine diphosphokinase
MRLIALGANLPRGPDSPARTLQRALDLLSREVGIVKQSRLYATPAVPAGSGPEFLNAVAEIGQAGQDPATVLATLHRVESLLGRTRTTRWAPRICDLDLLAFDDLVLPDGAVVRTWMDLPAGEVIRRTPEHIVLPHPRLHERAFVLVPLAEIAPEWTHPILRLTVVEMIARLPRDEVLAVRPIDGSSTLPFEPAGDK